MDSNRIADKEQMLNCFNKHFVASRFLFEVIQFGKKDEIRFKQIKSSDVYKAIELIGTNKSPDPDCLESVYLK